MAVAKYRLWQLLLLLSFSQLAFTQTWETPFYIAPPAGLDGNVEFVNFDPPSKNVQINMDEEFENVIIATLVYSGTQTPVLTVTTGGASRLDIIAQRNDEESNWDVVVKNKIDFENDFNLFRISVQCDQDIGEISLKISDINDNKPIFETNQVECVVPESQTGPTDCIFVISDLDSIQNKIVKVTSPGTTLSLSLGTPSVNNDLPVTLQVDVALDYEKSSVHILELTAQVAEDDPPELIGSARVILYVQDVSDTKPFWSVRPVPAFSVDENTDDAFEFIAVDGDTGINGKILYEIVGGPIEYITLEELSVGARLNVSKIDRDAQSADFYTIPVKIRAYEVDDNSSEIIEDIVIIVEDVNDNSPIINIDKTEITIDERFTNALDLIIEIDDPDLGQSGTYSIGIEDDSEFEWSSIFFIVPSSGYHKQTFTLTIQDPTSKLNYEDVNWREIILRIKATEVENPDHVGTAEVKIILKDINDESPIFTETYEISVEENVPADTIILIVQATDADANDILTYNLLTTYSGLTLNAETGELKVTSNKAFDYELQKEVRLQVECRDNAVPPHIISTPIVITLIDTNDTPPVLDVSVDIAPLMENAEVSTEVTSAIIAYDLDTTADLELSIDWDASTATSKGVPVSPDKFLGCLSLSTVHEDPPSDPTMGDSVTGILTVAEEKFDYETFDALYLVIFVNDKTTEANANERRATITITIANENDEPPKFSLETLNSEKFVSENIINNDTLIGYVIASDPDNLDPVIQYSLRPEDETPEGWVYINELGQLRTVGDTNNLINAEILSVQELHYTVIAADSELTSEERIVIKVVDENDESPVFNAIPDPIPISEFAESGTPITTVQATDADVSAWYSRLSYELDDSKPNYSQISKYIVVNGTTGEVSVAKLGEDGFLDADESREVEVGLRARDNSPPEPGKPGGNKFGYITIVLNLIDENDNSPEFEPTSGSEEVAESLLAGEVIYTGIRAIDIDAEDTPYSIVKYKINDTKCLTGPLPEVDLFGLSEIQQDKTISIIAAVNLATYFGEYEVTIEACDSAESNPMCTLQLFGIIITDLNDNKPVFVFPPDYNPPADPYQLRIRKNQSLGGILYLDNNDPVPSIEITDMDNGNNGYVDFEITSSVTAIEYFTLVGGDGKKATLQLNKLFPEDTPEPIDISITAADRGSPKSEETVIFKIFVIDTKQQPPAFEKVEETVKWEESNAAHIYTIPAAIDPNNINVDPNNHEAINYFLDDGDESIFEIGKTSRIVSLRRALDREETSSHELIIMATNADSKPSEEGIPEQYFTLIIDVEDIADSDPYFESELYPGGIAPSDSKGVEVIRLIAIDADSRDVDAIKYEIVGDIEISDDTLAGIIDPFVLETIEYNSIATGVLKTNFEPKDSMSGYFTFQISVIDSIGKHNETTVKVYMISASNRVTFVFINDIATVNTKRDYIAQVFTEYLKFDCSIDDVSDHDAQSGVKVNNTRTDVRTHFIDVEKNEPVPGKIIEARALNLATFNAMSAAFLEQDLIFIDVVAVQEVGEDNLAEVLTIVLIAVSVILGSLVLILFIAFVVKTRSLNRRLQALSTTKFGSQESGLNRIGMNVPNTNRHAVEGSNPVWNEDVPHYDNASVSSGGSELIGVEDNPEFNYGKEQEFRGSHEGGYYSGSDLQTAGRQEYDAHPNNHGHNQELSTEL